MVPGLVGLRVSGLFLKLDPLTRAPVFQFPISNFKNMFKFQPTNLIMVCIKILNISALFRSFKGGPLAGPQPGLVGQPPGPG